jgi:multiple sugar transport system ATP-binding protein
MRSEIIKLHAQVGGTFVYVTHDQIEAMTMGTKIALMRDGVVQQFGTARDIYTNPINTYVARFIGTPPMNLIAGNPVTGGIRFADTVVALDPDLLAAAGHHEVLVGVRPAALLVQPAGTPGTLAGEVALVEHIGAESLIAVRLTHVRTGHAEEGNGEDEVMATSPGYSDLKPGDKVGLLPDLSESVLFSVETGLRLLPQ